MDFVVAAGSALRVPSGASLSSMRTETAHPRFEESMARDLSQRQLPVPASGAHAVRQRCV